MEEKTEVLKNIYIGFSVFWCVFVDDWSHNSFHFVCSFLYLAAIKWQCGERDIEVCSSVITVCYKLLERSHCCNKLESYTCLSWNGYFMFLEI